MGGMERGERREGGSSACQTRCIWGAGGRREGGEGGEGGSAPTTAKHPRYVVLVTKIDNLPPRASRWWCLGNYVGMPSDSQPFSTCSVCQQECLCLAPCQPRLSCAAPMPIRWWCVGSRVRTPSHCMAAAASVPRCRNSCRTCGTRTSRRDSRQTGRRRGCRGLWRRLPSVTTCRPRGRRRQRGRERRGRRRLSSMRCSPRRLRWMTAAVCWRVGVGGARHL